MLLGNPSAITPFLPMYSHLIRSFCIKFSSYLLSLFSLHLPQSSNSLENAHLEPNSCCAGWLALWILQRSYLIRSSHKLFNCITWPFELLKAQVKRHHKVLSSATKSIKITFKMICFLKELSSLLRHPPCPLNRVTQFYVNAGVGFIHLLCFSGLSITMSSQ